MGKIAPRYAGDIGELYGSYTGDMGRYREIIAEIGSPPPRACGRSRRARRGGARGGNQPTAAARPALWRSCSRRGAPVRGGVRGRVRASDRDRFRVRVRVRVRVRGEVNVGRVLAEPPHLPHISPYLPHISAISPLNLP